MSDSILIEGGRRQGRTLQNEAAMRRAMAEGKTVYTVRNGVFFAVTAPGDGPVVYTALEQRPEGV
jgi:hypothetical protein